MWRFLSCLVGSLGSGAALALLLGWGIQHFLSDPADHPIGPSATAELRHVVRTANAAVRPLPPPDTAREAGSEARPATPGGMPPAATAAAIDSVPAERVGAATEDRKPDPPPATIAAAVAERSAQATTAASRPPAEALSDQEPAAAATGGGHESEQRPALLAASGPVVPPTAAALPDQQPAVTATGGGHESEQRPALLAASGPVMAPPAPAPVAAPQPTKPADEPGPAAAAHIRIHFRGSSAPAREDARQLATWLTSSGFGDTQLRTTAHRTQEAVVRYFSKSDASAASLLAVKLQKKTGSWHAEDCSNYRKKPPAGTIEVWPADIR